MTREYLPAIEISRWLTRECGLPFKEAADERARAMKELGYSTFDYARLAQANLNVYHAKLAAEKKAETNAKRQATRLANRTAESMPLNTGYMSEPLPPRQPDKDSCVSCGDETFQCACEVKRVDDIPF